MHIATPQIESRALGRGAGRSVYLKLEASQPSGSFKLRGIGHACREYARRGARRFVSSSGGNAGIAVAHAGRHLGIPVTVVVPETSTPHARALIAQEGAEVIVHGASWQEANAQALSLRQESDAFLHPFDDPLIWAGHASLIDEVAAVGVKPGAVIVAVGGGGLLCGVLEGLHRNAWGDVPVIAVETDGADSLAQSMAAGRRVTLPAITSIATSLGAKQVCEQAFAWTRKHAVRSLVVSDREAVTACLRFLDEHRVLVEPACGAALAVVHERSPELRDYSSVLVVVCGGATTTLEDLRRYAAAG